MRSLAVLLAVGVVLLIAQVGSSSNPPGFTCSGAQSEISNWNTDPVSGGGTPPTLSTGGQYLCLNSIATYHTSAGAGSTGGTIGLTQGTTQLGPYAATAAAATTGFFNWVATPPTDTVIHGSYTCNDSDPASWAQNATSGGFGFCKFFVQQALDATAPTISLTAPADGAKLAGTVQLSYSATDAESGISHVDVQTSAPAASSWTTRATLAPGVTSWDSHTVPDGSYDFRLVAVNGTGGTAATASVGIVVDNTAPTIAVQCNTGTGAAACGTSWYTKAVDVTAVASDANGTSGQLLYTTDGTPPLLSNTAQPYTGAIHVTVPTTVRFDIADTFGNIADVSVPLKVDTTPPPAPTIGLGSASQGAFLKHAGVAAYTLYHRSTVAGTVQLAVPAGDDPESGVASVNFPTSFALSTWHVGQVNPLDATYSWDANPGEPSALTLASTNTAGLTGPASTVSFVADDTAPGLTLTCDPASCANPNGPVTITASASDAGSGLAGVRYTTDGTDPTPTNGVSGTTATIVHPATVKFAAFDRLGNTAVASTAVTAASLAPGAFTVNTTSDTHDAVAGDGACADSSGACSLRAAIEEANALPAGSAISVPGGSYTLALGALTVQNGMTITGAGARTTTVSQVPSTDREHVGNRVFDVTAAAGPVTIAGLTLSGGSATDAAGFFGGDVRNAGNLTLREDTITNGTASSGGGVGNAGGTLLIDHSTISGNSAPFGGGDSGGVQNWGDGTHHGALTVETSTISGNNARLGGGIYVWNDPANTTVISNSTISGNSGGDRGTGGVGTANGATATVRNSIIAGNVVTSGTIATVNNCSGTIQSLGHNLESGTDCGFTATGDIRSANPQLGSLQNNGGPTDTLLPAATSPAIDAGDDATCQSTDQRGTSRPQGTHCDIGAVELGVTSTWSLSQAMLANVAQPVPTNPFGPWEMESGNGVAHNPAVYTSIAASSFASAGCGGTVPGLANFSGTENGFPVFAINTTPAAIQPGSCAPFQIDPPAVPLAHPSPTSLAIYAWHSPITGTVSIGAAFKDADAGGGTFSDGIAWSVDRNATTLASGSYSNGGSSPPISIQTNVSRGDTIYFTVDPKAAFNNDQTEVDATIALQSAGAPAPSQTLTVTNTNDSGAGSLRDAINQANSRSGPSTITFNIPGGGVHTIGPVTQLPPITAPVTIDGYTQPGSQPATNAVGDPTDAVLNVVLNGDALPTGTGAAGLQLVGAGATVRGLVINGGFTYGIRLDGTGSTNNTVVGNYIGTSADGLSADGVVADGVLVSGGAFSNKVGLPGAANRNVISGNGEAGVAITGASAGNSELGDVIGLSANGTTYIPNGTGVVLSGGTHDNKLGDGNKADGSTISGNKGAGVVVTGTATTGNTISGDWIGVDFFFDNGQHIFSGNGGDGIAVSSGASGNAIAGNNVIANNNGSGVSVVGATGIAINSNTIRNNGGLGIDLGNDGVTANDAGDADTGANNLQNFPTITDVGSNGLVSGTVNSTPNTALRIEVSGTPVCDPSGNGEGNFAAATSVTTDASGNAAFNLTAVFGSGAQYATATATNAQTGDTSEFSSCFKLTQSNSVLTVNTPADHDDGTCSAGDCTLREAINAANANRKAVTIRFAIGTGGPQTIHLLSPLPPIGASITIDGTSEPGWLAAPIITVDGSTITTLFASNVPGVDGISIQGTGSTVRGLVVDGFTGIGIHATAANATIAGNWVGITPAGSAAAGNSGDGIRVETTTGATVGGTAPLDRNVVGGNGGHGIFLFNSTSSTVVGNYSGTNAGGTAALPNAIDGIAVDGGNTNTISGNLSSGNTGQGISVFTVNAPTETYGNVVRGNSVGTTAAGSGTIANGGDGIRVAFGLNNVIGGTGTGQANVVRGNTTSGVAIRAVGAGVSVGNTISGNAISSNGGAGIVLELGQNDDQKAPSVTAADATQVSGSLAAAPNATYTVEAFANSTSDCEGETYLGSTQVTTDANGAASWKVGAAIDPGSYLSATATNTQTGDTSPFSATCFQLQNSTTLFATVSVDQSSTTAGAQSFSLDSLPPQLFTQLATGDPSSAPIPSAPIPSAAVGAAPIPSAPIPSAPIPSAPIPSAPIPSAPIPSAPIPSAPIPSAPIPSAGLQGLPIPSADIQNPLDAILLSSLPGLDVNAIFAGTSIAGKLPQQYTLGDIYRTPSALAYFESHYSAAALQLGGTLLRGVRTLSYLLGDKPIATVLGPNWCTILASAGGSCLNANGSTTTVIGLDIMHQLGNLDLGHYTVHQIGGLTDTLVGSARLARIAFQETTMAKIPVSAVPGITSCTTCATLGDAAAAHAVNDVSTTLLQLGSLLDNVTLNELVVALTPRNALPWEQESYLGWQGFGGQATPLQYHVDFDAVCPITGLSVRVKLPYGFVYVPGSSTVQLGVATPTAVADPALDPSRGATWSSISTAACPSGTQHVRLSFQGEAGYRLGVSPSTAAITVNGVSTLVSGAPVLVQRNWPAALDRSTEPTLSADTIYLSHIDAAGATNYFKFPELGRGKQVTIYMKPPAGSDYDLYVVRPAPSSLLASPIPSAPIPSAPIPSAPIPSAPIPSADTSVSTATDNPAPELLDDGPLPGGQVSVDSITRGDGVEAVTFRQSGNTGYDEIAVAGYNGAFSSDPFELRISAQDPPPLPPQCPARSLTPLLPGSLPAGVTQDTQNLALVNVGRMNAMYGVDATSTMLTHLQTVMSSVHGAVIPIDGDSGVAAAAQAWDQSPCSIDAANNYVHAINTLVAGYRATLTNLQSITIVGDDEQIPFARVADFVPTSSEFDNVGPLSFLTQGGTTDNATYAAAALGYVLTDDAYGAFHTRTLFGHEFFLPEVAVGRLVETPQEIDGQLQQFIANNGTLSPTTGFVTGYDFMSDGSLAVDNGLSGRVGNAPSATNTLLRDTWGKSALQPFLSGSTAAAGINSWNAHYDFHRLMPAVYTGPSDLLTTDLLPASVSQRFAGRIFFTMGCHAGESIADTLFANAVAQTHDWAQSYSQASAAVFVGNTGFGYGDTASVALSERLMSIFAGHLAFNGSVGEKLMQSKNDYFATMGAYGPYDEKALEEATFYGLPFWQVNSPTEPVPTPPGPLAQDGSLQTAPLTITPKLTKVADPRGTFWTGDNGDVFVPGRSVQPLTTVEVTQPASSGLVAHGFFPNALVTDDSNKGLNLYFAKPMVDQASHEPEPLVTNDVFPASPVKMSQADYLGRRHSTLDVIDGQSRPGSAPSLQNERLITSISGSVTYAPASATDYTPPQFGQTGSFVSGGTATIFATVTDPGSGVLRVRAFFTTGGPWQFVDLVPGAGNLWTGQTSVSTDKIEVGFVAEDGTGNTGWMTGKGILVESYTPASPPPAPSIAIKQPLDGGTYTLGQSLAANYLCTSTVVVQSCAGPVVNGSAVDTSTLGTKTFEVDAQDVVGTHASKTATYAVVYNFGGFQSPINPNTLNVVKSGSSVPVKFSLHGNFGTAIIASGYPKSGTVPCGGTATLTDTTTTTGSSGLQYDATTDTYTYVWQTQKAWSGTCRQLVVVLNDGVVHRASFQFK